MSKPTCREMFQNWLETNLAGDVRESGVPNQVLLEIVYQKKSASNNSLWYVWLGPKGAVRWHWQNDFSKSKPMDSKLLGRMKVECYSNPQ